MAQIEPLRALHYNLEKTGGLQNVVAPPYDVIDDVQREDLEARSPYNVVRIDLPRGEDPYRNAAEILSGWRAEHAVVRDEEPALWVLEQDYTGPDGNARTRRGFLARVRVEEYGPGRIRPHERTHPGPKEDRLRLTRATQANLSPIFSLFNDPANAAWETLEPTTSAAPWGEATDEDGTANRVWRVTDPSAIDSVQRALAEAELLIADGHHRYETARTYAEEVGGDGEHRFVLMDLVALQDPGLTVFPTHRLVRGLAPAQRNALASAIKTSFDTEELDHPDQLANLQPEPGKVRIGYIDSHSKRPFLLTLTDEQLVDETLADHAEPYRRLDTAVVESLLLKGALGMTDEDIDHLNGLGYARDGAQALAAIDSGEYDAAFMLPPIPVEQIQEVAAAGESMPPKSTYFFPKVPTGLIFNVLSD